MPLSDTFNWYTERRLRGIAVHQWRITLQISDAPLPQVQNEFIAGARSLHLLVRRLR
jgi:hypothetical protein